jgi:hypothetical protein
MQILQKVNFHLQSLVFSQLDRDTMMTLTSDLGMFDKWICFTASVCPVAKLRACNPDY